MTQNAMKAPEPSGSKALTTQTHRNPFIRPGSRIAPDPFCQNAYCLLVGCDWHVWCPAHGSVRPDKCCGLPWSEYALKRDGQLNHRDQIWMTEDHAWTDEHLLARQALSVPFGVRVSWRDSTFRKATVTYIHPDERNAYAESRLGFCKDHKSKGVLVDGCRSCYPKSRCGKGENGLALARPAARTETGSKRWLLVEGIGQSGAAASWAPEGVGVVGMNGCRGVHPATDNGPATDLSWVAGGQVLLMLDADRHTNKDVAKAAVSVPRALYEAGAARVVLLDVPGATGKDGVDDVLAAMVEDERAPFLANLTDGWWTP